MFRVRDTSTGQIVPGTPSPLLIILGGGEAYRTTGESGSLTGFWRARDNAYDAAHAPGVVYTRVRVEHVSDWRVDMNITVLDRGEEAERYDDYFNVQAATRTEAEDLAADKAREDVARRNGDDVNADIRILRAREGVSI